MDRRHFLKNLSAIATALLVAPRLALKELSTSLFASSGCSYHFAHTWDGDIPHIWIDGEEVFGKTGQSCKDVTITNDFYRVVGTDQGSISFWIAPPDEARHFDGAIDKVEVHSGKIPWTRMSDDSPFEPPPRTDPPLVVDSDIGEGEDLIDSWW